MPDLDIKSIIDEIVNRRMIDRFLDAVGDPEIERIINLLLENGCPASAIVETAMQIGGFKT